MSSRSQSLSLTVMDAADPERIGNSECRINRRRRESWAYKQISERAGQCYNCGADLCRRRCRNRHRPQLRKQEARTPRVLAAARPPCSTVRGRPGGVRSLDPTPDCLHTGEHNVRLIPTYHARPPDGRDESDGARPDPDYRAHRGLVLLARLRPGLDLRDQHGGPSRGRTRASGGRHRGWPHRASHLPWLATYGAAMSSSKSRPTANGSKRPRSKRALATLRQPTCGHRDRDRRGRASNRAGQPRRARGAFRSLAELSRGPGVSTAGRGSARAPPSAPRARAGGGSRPRFAPPPKRKAAGRRSRAARLGVERLRAPAGRRRARAASTSRSARARARALEGQRAGAAAAVTRRQREAEERRIRAAVDGRLGEIAPLPGRRGDPRRRASGIDRAARASQDRC